MRYEIESEKRSSEPRVTLKFERNGDGSISVLANGWYIIRFTNDGTLKRCGSVPADIGFKTGRAGVVLMSDELADI